MYALNLVNTYDVCHFFYIISIANVGDSSANIRLVAQPQSEFWFSAICDVATCKELCEDLLRINVDSLWTVVQVAHLEIDSESVMS